MNSRTRKIIAAIVSIVLVAVIVIAVLIALGPKTGQVYTGLNSVTCVYQVNVVAFVDTNSDGVQNSSENGLAGVGVALQHSQPFTAQSAPENRTTDSTGSAQINADTYCGVGDTLTVNIAPPAGYSAATPLSFGPYPVPEFTSSASTQAAAHPIPATIYVGLKES